MSDNQPKNTSKPKKKLPKAKKVVEKQAKATKAEVIQRVSEVQALLLQGYTRSHIVQYGANSWNLAERQIDDYIAMARVNIQEVSMAGLKDDLATIISAMWDTFRRAVIQNNVGEQRQTLMAIAKLKGLDETRINHVIDDKRQLAGLSDQELDSILEQDESAKH